MDRPDPSPSPLEPSEEIFLAEEGLAFTAVLLTLGIMFGGLWFWVAYNLISLALSQ